MFWKPFSKEQEADIVRCIRHAEKNTSAELVLHVEKYCKVDPSFRAIQVFNFLNISQTQEKNGILLYIALKDHKFYILGDTGINEKVGSNYWTQISAELGKGIISNGLVPSIINALKKMGEELAKHYPPQENNQNELSDDISYGKKLF